MKHERVNLLVIAPALGFSPKQTVPFPDDVFMSSAPSAPDEDALMDDAYPRSPITHHRPSDEDAQMIDASTD